MLKRKRMGAAELPERFDAVTAQYPLVLDFSHLEGAGMVPVRGAKEKGDIREQDQRKAYRPGHFSQTSKF